MGAIIGGHPGRVLVGAAGVSASACLFILLAVDAAFVVAHFAYKNGLTPDTLFHLGKDGGYAEMFQYAKTGSVVMLLGALWLRSRERVYAAWVILFAYVLADDVLRIHERGGGLIAAWAQLPDAFGLGGQDFGEIAVSTTCGGTIAVLLAANYLRGSRVARVVSQNLALLFGVLVFFGVLLDMLHAAVEDGAMKLKLGATEDGGEMAAMSFICWYLLKLRQQGDPARVVPQAALR